MKIETTGIGSLPFPYVDQALLHAMGHSVPFFPQLPARDPREFALPQALDGFPGASLRAGGFVGIDLDQFAAHRGEWTSDDLLPRPESSAAFRPFLAELEEKRPKLAKLELAGPVTALWATKVPAEVGAKIVQFLVARARAMMDAVRERGVEPILFWDEPALFSIRSATDLAPLASAMRELKGARVGLHCCSNTRWSDVLALGFDTVSFDTALSLDAILPALRELDRQPRLALGVVPTNRMGTSFFPSQAGEAWAREIASEITSKFSAHSTPLPSELWLSAACGLALQAIPNALATRELLDLVAEELS